MKIEPITTLPTAKQLISEQTQILRTLSNVKGDSEGAASCATTGAAGGASGSRI